jgi:hypothetical protein
MPRLTGRATTAALDQLHGLTVRAVTRDLKAALKSKEPVPTQLLRAAQDLLKITDSTDPVRTKRPAASAAAGQPARATSETADGEDIEMPDYSDDAAPKAASERTNGGTDGTGF